LAEPWDDPGPVPSAPEEFPEEPEESDEADGTGTFGVLVAGDVASSWEAFFPDLPLDECALPPFPACFPLFPEF
jgi:hypothetical protein